MFPIFLRLTDGSPAFFWLFAALSFFLHSSAWKFSLDGSVCVSALTEHFCTRSSKKNSEHNVCERNVMNKCKGMHHRNWQEHTQHDKDALTVLYYSLHLVLIVLDIVYMYISGMCGRMNGDGIYRTFKLFRWNEIDKVRKPSSQASQPNFKFRREGISPLNMVAC